MALKLSLDAQGTRIVDNITNSIETRHNSTGSEDIVPLYIFNDGKRYGMDNDDNPPELIYTNLMISLEGVQHRLQEAVPASTGSVSLQFDSTEGWNIGTILTSNTERMRVERLESNGTGVVVKRNYTDGGSSVICAHNINDPFLAETKSTSIALPDPSNYDSPGTFGAGGATMNKGVDPTYLASSIDSRPTSNIVRSSSGVKYFPKSLIKIDNEIMRVDAISGNDLTVTRAYGGTTAANHTQNALIHCVGIVDVMTANNPMYSHKIFLKVQPVQNLPTQKKKDIVLVVTGDESAL